MDSVRAFRSEPDLEHAPGADKLSRGLGWFSIGIGLAELAMPRIVARVIGADPDGHTPMVLRAMGVREIAAGINVLLRPRRAGPLWMRVAGDVVDLALLGVAATNKQTGLVRVVGAATMVAGVTALDAIAAQRMQRLHAGSQRPVIFSVTINKPPAEVYAFFRKFSQLPLFMTYLESVHETDDRHSHWVAKLPVGKLAWDAEITEDVPGEMIAWRSEGSAVKLEGRVTFARTPGRDMTEVRIEMRGGFVGVRASSGIARIFSKPQVKGDLRRLKQVIETGEVLYSDASAHTKPHPAQPSRDVELPSQLPFIPQPPTAEKGVVR